MYVFFSNIKKVYNKMLFSLGIGKGSVGKVPVTHT